MRRALIVLVVLAATVALASPASAGRTKHFEGTYTGEEFFQLFTSRCPFLDHVYDNVLDLDRGPDGTYHAVACATITEGNLFSAEGSFTIRLPGGTVTGTYSTSTRLPPSLPGQIVHDITGGTRRFKGASGTCVLTLRSLVSVEFGHQLHSGTWVCDITR